MKKEKIQLESIHLIGMTARTNNKNEMNPDTAKIGALASHYWGQQIANQFKDRVKPGVTYSVYTDFESDENGEYTYFIGEEVSSLDNQDLSTFKSLVIPNSTYQKFTTQPGKIPAVVIEAWQKIWQMQNEDFGGMRKYAADFEIYDQRAQDLQNAIVDIYIGIVEI